MLDWKILAASFAALLFVSSMFIGDFAIQDFFSTVVEKIGEWLGGSPFGGMVTAPTSSVIEGNTVNVKIYPERFTIIPDNPVNITFDGKEITDFSGEIVIDYSEKKITFDESNSRLNIIIPIENTEITDLKIKKVIIHNKEIDVNTEDWDLSNKNGSIEVYDFSGIVEITTRMIELKGNMSKLVRL